jgi:enoyl-CoA hydratase
MSYENLKYEVLGVSCVLTVSREKALNALNAATLAELAGALARAADDPQVRGVILTGAGEKAFVAGADIAEMKGHGPAEARALAELGHRVGDAIERLPKPVVAAVNGFALGGGCELALACDFIYAADKARFGQPEVNLGVMAGFGGTQRLPRRIGPARAMELLLTGDLIGAEEALRLGLVNKVVPAAQLLDEARQTIEKIAQKGPLAVAATKRAVRRGGELPLGAANELERELFAHLFSSADQKEGMEAFLGKRAAQFKGS